jgi:hypothetical protein
MRDALVEKQDSLSRGGRGGSEGVGRVGLGESFDSGKGGEEIVHPAISG